MDKCLQLQCLAVGEGRIDHVVGPVGVGTVAGRIGRAAHQLAHDEVTDGVFVVADDEDSFAHLHLLENGIDDEALAAEPKLAIVLGTEGDGLARSTIAACDYTVKIPMSHGVDSLNVAAASAVAFWQLGKH